MGCSNEGHTIKRIQQLGKDGIIDRHLHSVGTTSAEDCKKRSQFSGNSEQRVN